MTSNHNGKRHGIETGILSEWIVVIALIRLFRKGVIKFDRIIPVGLISQGVIPHRKKERAIALVLDGRGIDILVQRGEEFTIVQVKTRPAALKNPRDPKILLVATNLGRSRETKTPSKCLSGVEEQLIRIFGEAKWKRLPEATIL
ncbi:MAG: hypothetical protein Q8P39_02570 [Candidatus Yanofskybacteria bacterium]|nr:hypothetical protein [Candidatus Yanofskybacteria bacterium]